ncbi:MAG: heat-inducible transcriptional repressor HrcA [Elusimicrobiota bacterium]|jgi:heat-inducible transcriptional repressor|nr:heat-inducible transcriptional repressor HrcA [Elusimicrobiota bacterium]
MDKTLTDRKKYILQLIINEYIKTGRPVSSNLICSEYNLNYSSATIRNEIAKLEKEGYLMQPHISAGRIPTNLGYRYYVDFLTNIQKITKKEEKQIKKEFDSKINELDKIMQQTSKMLAMISEFAGFSIASNINESKIDYIQLSRIGDNTSRILFLVVTEDNLVKHKIIDLDYEIDYVKIIELTEIFNDKFKGKNLSEFTKSAIDIVLEEQKKAEKIIMFVKDLVKNLSNVIENNLYYLEESHNFLNNIDFDDEVYQNLKKQEIIKTILDNNFLEKLSEKNDNLLKKDKTYDVKIYIGEMELNNLLKDCSLVTNTYKIGEKNIGVLGIIGPKRMNYDKMIGIVEFVSKLVNKLIK